MQRSRRASLLALETMGAKLLACLALILPAQARAQADAGAENAVADARLRSIYRGAVPANAEELRALQTRVKQIWKRAREATVTLRGAAGVLVSGGYVLTAGHVTKEAGRRVRMTLSDGRSIYGETLGGSSKTDAGLVRVTSKGDFPSLEIADSSKLARGAWVVMLGFPGSRLSEGPPLRFGRVTRNPASGYLVSDCRMCAGDSGGPLVDLFGRVVGINSRITRDLARNMHVPTATFLREWDGMLRGDWIEERKVGAYLGVEQRAGERGARIVRVLPGTAAERAGLRKDDVIPELDGRALGARTSLPAALRRFRAGQRVRIRVLRGDEEITLRVRFGRRES